MSCRSGSARTTTPTRSGPDPLSFDRYFRTELYVNFTSTATIFHVLLCKTNEHWDLSSGHNYSTIPRMPNNGSTETADLLGMTVVVIGAHNDLIGNVHTIFRFVRNGITQSVVPTESQGKSDREIYHIYGSTVSTAWFVIEPKQIHPRVHVKSVQLCTT